MKKITAIIFILFSSHILFTDSFEISKVDMSSLYYFDIGNKDTELRYYKHPTGSEPDGPTSIYIFEGYYYIYDYWNGKIVKLSDDFSEFITYDYDVFQTFANPNLIIGNKTFIITDDRQDRIYISSFENNNNVFDITKNITPSNYFDDYNISNSNFVYTNNKLIGQGKNGTFINIELNGFENQELNSIYINHNTEINDFDIITRPEDVMILIKNRTDDTSLLQAKLKEWKFSQKAIFSGIDIDGNTYWSKNSVIFIFNQNYNLIRTLVVDRTITSNSTMNRFSINDKGDLYKIVYNEIN